MKRIISFALSLLLILFASVFSVSGREEYGRIYCRSSVESKRIALTFDDGPHPRFTPEILEILKEYGIVATFFIIGVNATTYPDTLQMIADSGCEIGNHTYSHKRLGKLSPDEIEEEIRHCEEVLVSMTGIRPKLFRPPEGAVVGNLEKIAERSDYNIVLWSVDTLDWKLTPAPVIYKTVTDQVRGGDIILMHDYVSGGNTTCEALRNMIPKLLEDGYEFVTVSELICSE